MIILYIGIPNEKIVGALAHILLNVVPPLAPTTF